MIMLIIFIFKQIFDLLVTIISGIANVIALAIYLPLKLTLAIMNKIGSIFIG